MGATYKIDTSIRLKYVRIYGKTDYDELERLFYQYIRDPDFEPDLRLLVDLRQMSDPVAGLWEIAKLNRLYRYAYRDAVSAVDVVILAGSDVSYRVARIFALFMRDKRPMDIRITRNLPEALAKLHVSHETVRRLQADEADDCVVPLANYR